MSNLLDRARRARARYGTDTPLPQPENQHDAAPPAPVVAGPAAPQATTGEPAPASRARKTRVARTRISGTWVAVIIAVLVLVVLLIFILQNPTRTELTFLGAGGTLPIGVAMLLAAVAGALLIALIGSARILQLRHTARRRRP
ncbi:MULTISPECIES: lipopolysaccharide assembly protein LapA domain-containing protein [Amycolatopsis]|uniref:Lipopolysaccharide assembly protein LapA domain-containing protein n=1 Tax=Amycolatopsis thermalba TaxID=944492 RepID=A0ABY4NZE2_9PSEU|nr:MULTISPECIES: lipopolysaccharide assembly protein LapA domain-containing protein [Amycolatopsis]UQS25413.1 lipopolysaccharide assembly protein LapA domain-containing protein [Amycolatopsis thermalba]